MPEDQGVNGDIWNDEADRLFKTLGWTSVGDSNIDIENVDDKKNGIDRMYKYQDFTKGNVQGVFLEAKRYKVSSFSKSNLQKWIGDLNTKIQKLRNSESLYDTYPGMEGVALRNGLIVIWFSDANYYTEFASNFIQILSEIKLPLSTKKEINRIFVLENNGILKLASIVDAVEKYKRKNNAKVLFYYHSSDRYRKAGGRTETLSLEYIYSQFMFADAIDENTGLESKIVFYFGPLRTDCFKTLRDALLQYDYVVKHKPLTIYIYERSDEFRKIKPDIEALFDSKVDLKTMTKFSDLPDFMKE